MNKFRFADSVSMRLVQIFQEAIMTGIDGADLLRQVELQPLHTDEEILVLTPEYEQSVKESYVKLEAKARELLVKHKSKLIIGLDGSGTD